jgi:hypothetical protein
MGILVTYGYDDLYQKNVYQLAGKKGHIMMRGEKSDAGGPDEKQIYLCGLIFKLKRKMAGDIFTSAMLTRVRYHEWFM